MEPQVYITKITEPFQDCACLIEKLVPEEKAVRLNKQRMDRRAVSVAAECLLALAVYERENRLVCREARRVNGYGKPFLEGGPFFSLSHSEDIALAAVFDTPVGADIQYKRSFSAGTPRRVLSAEELERYAGSADPASFFFAVWTLKESYLKYAGTGLTRDPREVTCYPWEGRIVCNTNGCVFTLFEGEEYCLAVCTELSCPAPRFIEWGALRNQIEAKYL